MKLATILLLAVLAGSAPALAADRYSFITLAYGSDASGNAVVDGKTGLTWRRCSEGQTWNGATCAGAVDCAIYEAPGCFSHEAALVHAKVQVGWRLPNVKELASIADRSRINPAIDTTAFPGTVSSWYWSSTPHVGHSFAAWAVSFDNGMVQEGDRGFPIYHVRLVRASQ